MLFASSATTAASGNGEGPNGPRFVWGLRSHRVAGVEINASLKATQRSLSSSDSSSSSPLYFSAYSDHRSGSGSSTLSATGICV